jgi:hypothetical protein
MATLLHALAALVLGNFRFASFFERAHSDFSDSRAGIEPSNPPGCNNLFAEAAGISQAAIRYATRLGVMASAKV